MVYGTAEAAVLHTGCHLLPTNSSNGSCSSVSANSCYMREKGSAAQN